MDFKSTSRRDDIISIFYVLIWLLYDKSFLGLDLSGSKNNLKQRYHAIKEYKTTTSLEQMAFLFSHKFGQFYSQTSNIVTLAKNIQNLGFKDEPNY